MHATFFATRHRRLRAYFGSSHVTYNETLYGPIDAAAGEFQSGVLSAFRVGVPGREGTPPIPADSVPPASRNKSRDSDAIPGERRRDGARSSQWSSGRDRQGAAAFVSDAAREPDA